MESKMEITLEERNALLDKAYEYFKIKGYNE